MKYTVAGIGTDATKTYEFTPAEAKLVAAALVAAGHDAKAALLGPENHTRYDCNAKTRTCKRRAVVSARWSGIEIMDSAVEAAGL